MDESHIRVQLRITGSVQGVFYRDSTRRRALALGVSGWVRNCADGSVEAVAEGPPAAIEALVHWCHEGPPAAQVEAVEVAKEPARGQYQTFEVVY